MMRDNEWEDTYLYNYGRHAKLRDLLIKKCLNLFSNKKDHEIFRLFTEYETDHDIISSAYFDLKNEMRQLEIKMAQERKLARENFETKNTRIQETALEAWNYIQEIRSDTDNGKVPDSITVLSLYEIIDELCEFSGLKLTWVQKEKIDGR